MSHYRFTIRATLLAVLAIAAVAHDAGAQTFVPTAGTHVWNDDNNWGPAPPQPFPNASGAAATISAPTDVLSIDLGQPITLGSLTIAKSTVAAFDTMITGTAPNGLTFDGGGTIATTASFATGGGTSIVAAPVAFNGLLTVTQGDDQVLRFTGGLSGSGALSVKRNTDGEGVVAISFDSTYGGGTTVTGNAGTAYTVLRLNSANAIPGGIGATGGTSNITLTNSAILGLGSTDFKRSIGTGSDQIQFVAALSSGFAAFDATRVVNFGGASAPVAWATSGIATLTFGAPTSSATVDFQNPLDFGTANRTIRAVDGTAAIDGKISASMTSTGPANSLTKTGSGTLSLAAANSYTGNTIINAGALRVDHPQALPAATNIALSGGGVLGLGVADYAATIGTGPGQLQFGTGAAGFAAYGGNRKVTLNGGAPLVWGAGSLNIATNFILSDEGSDSLIEFTNAIDLNGLDRTFAGRNGTAAIDSKITGAISGTGGFIKTQAGTLELPVANSYTGNTVLSGGVLLATNANSIPGGIHGAGTGNISFVGGVIGLGESDFTAPLGYGAGQVQWTAAENGGFAAFGGHRVVNLGGANAPVLWGVDGFASANLILSWAGSDGLIEFTNPIDLNGGARTFAGRDGTLAIDSRVSSVVGGLGSVIKTQPGTLEFTVANTYDGGTVIEAGRLLANNTSGSAFGAGDVTVTADGTLGGTGFVGTAADASNVVVNADGRIAPGVSAGKLSIAGDVTWEAGSFFDVEVAGTTPGVQFDQLAIDGAATLAGTLQVSTLEGFAPAIGSSFTVLTASDGITGTFDKLTSTGAAAWRLVYGANSASLVATYAADYDADGDVDANDLAEWKAGSGLATGATRLDGDGDSDGDVDGVDFLLWQSQAGSVTPPIVTAAAAVPEPGSFAMFCIGALGAATFRRRARSADGIGK